MLAFADGSAVRVEERDYAPLVLASVEAARSRIWASIFIHDVRPIRDLDGQVLDLTMAMIERKRAGVDVRVLLAGAVSTPDIAVANLATGLLLEGHGVPHRRLFETGPSPRAGSHAKFALCDDLAVVGSQNWTDDAFRLNIEDAVLLRGAPTAVLAREFARLWEHGRRLPRDAAV